jgi:hypothetical protein
LHISGRDGLKIALLVKKTDVPQWRVIRPKGIESVDTVVFSGDEQNIALAFASYLDRGKKKRLRINCSVDLECP